MLRDVRIIDLSWVLGGPFGGQALAQLGAEVIKIEPLKGDMARTIPPHFFGGDSAFFLSVNRGKKSVALDLKNPDGLATLYDLVRHSHAVIYGFSADVPKKLGIDFESLLKVNPKIVVGQLIGLHDEPPYDNAPAFDLIIQALSGVLSITGEKGGPPARVGYQVADLAGGLYLALATVSALFSAAFSGKGREIQISLLDCQLAMLSWQAQNYFISGEVPDRLGTRHAMIAPNEVFSCADGEHIVISPTGEEFWRKFCVVIGRTDLAADARFVTAKERIRNVDALAGILSDILREKTRDQWQKQLFDAGVPVAPVLDVAQALAQPIVALRAMVEQVASPSGDELAFLGNPFKYASASKLSYPPAVGADTKDVLQKICGYSDARIATLYAEGAIGMPDPVST